MATQMRCPSCGYAGTYKTPTLATAHFPRHSCEKQARLDARAARVVAAKTREGVKRDCECKHARHEHGTRTAYVVDKCRCRPCTTASSEANATRNKQQAYGRYDSGRVDAEPVREHIAFLGEHGVSLKQLAKLTGLSLSTVGATMYGRSERGHAPYSRTSLNTATKILAIKPTLDNMAAYRVIDNTGTLRRLQALVTIGWSMSRLGQHLGVGATNMSTLMKSSQTTAGRARQVRALYEELWDQPQTGHEQRSKISASRSKRYARERGWHPPMAWNDDATIDNPKAKPRTDKATAPQTARLEDLHHLATQGTSWYEIHQRLNIPIATITDWAKTNNFPDLAQAAQTAKTDARNTERKAA